MNKSIKMLSKKNKGITMIALVVTIVVLLILSGISISFISGNDSVIQQAGQAKINTERAEERESLDVAIMLAINKNKHAELEVGNLKESITQNTEATPGDETEFPVTATFSVTGNVYLIDSEGKVTIEGETTSSTGGLSADGTYFIGLKSIGKKGAGEIDNYWQSATPVTIEGKDGYKFETGHFVHISDYSGSLWDEATNSFQNKTNVDVYLCWEDDYGDNIRSELDLRSYALSNSITTYWDIFDASSGAWLDDDSTIPPG